MQTDIKKIRDTSKMIFDLISYEEARESIDESLRDIIISHPFTNSGFSFNQNTKEMYSLNNEKGWDTFRNQIFSLIDKSDLMRIYMLLNKPYKLFWFSKIRHYLSEEDYAKMLKITWTDSENPNMDVNVPIEMSLGFFQECNMNYLMDDEEKEVFDNLKDELTLYRGVSKNRTPYGLSYTFNLDKAIWFKDRFKVNDDDGFLITLNVKKEDCLCYINSRGEDEIVLNINPYLNDIKKQISREK